MKLKEMITEEKCQDCWTNSPNLYQKKCIEAIKENRQVDVKAWMVNSTFWWYCFLCLAISFKAKFENVQFETCAALESKRVNSWSDPSWGERLTNKQVL